LKAHVPSFNFFLLFYCFWIIFINVHWQFFSCFYSNFWSSRYTDLKDVLFCHE
jgi:hypothetical protein